MELHFLEIRRIGERLIKYKMDADETKHFLCYKIGNMYFSFIMHRGLLVDRNDREITAELVAGSKKKGKYFDHYFYSSLNEYLPKGSGVKSEHVYDYRKTKSIFN